MTTSMLKWLAFTILLQGLVSQALHAAGTDPQAHELLVPSEWERDFDKAQQRALAEARPILVVAARPGCGPCHYMSEKVHPTAEFKEASKEYVIYYLDIEANEVGAERFKVEISPALLVLSPEGMVREQFIGCHTPPGVARFLKGHKARWARIESLRKILAKSPERAAAWRELGDLLSDGMWFSPRQDASTAVEVNEAYKKAAALDPKIAAEIAGILELAAIQAGPDYAGVADGSGDPAAMEKRMKELEVKYPAPRVAAPAMLTRAISIANQGRDDEAKALMREGAVKYKDDPLGSYFQGFVDLFDYMAQKEKDAAAK